MLGVLKPSVRPKPWSGDAYRALVLKAAKFDTRHLVRAIKRADAALDAENEYQEPDHRVRLDAAKFMFLLAGLAAQPRASVDATFNGPVVIQWQTSSSPTSPALSNGHSTRHLQPNGHGSASSSSTDALESL
jgi:hypothetical protein